VSRVIFGSDAGETGAAKLAGDSRSDRLYGGGGADDLVGGAGQDRLEGQDGDDILEGGVDNDLLLGGKGQDTYIEYAGDGRDLIVDQDGLGRIQIGSGASLPLVYKIGEGVWQSQDKAVTMSLVAQGANRNDLVIAMAGSKDRIVVRDWSTQRSLGLDILMQDAPAVELTYDLIREGDKQKTTYADNDGDGLPEYEFNNGWLGAETLMSYITVGPQVDAQDVLFALDMSSHLSGLGGNDALVGNRKADLLEGGAGADLILGAGGGDVIRAGSGNDFVLAGAANSRYWAPDSSDEADDYWGTPNFPVLALSGHSSGFDWGVFHPDGWLVGNIDVYPFFVVDDDGNRVEAGDGDDFVFGGWYTDYLSGGADRDYIQGGAGADVIFGGSGDDRIDADRSHYLLEQKPLSTEQQFSEPRFANVVRSDVHGDDVVDAGPGNDSAYGDGGDDILYGGLGNDYLEGDSGKRSTVDAGGELRAEGDPAYHGSDLLDGGAGADTLIGGGRDDQLFGGDDDDQLVGDETEENLAAAFHGNDLLDGGAGDDRLWGGGGADELYGGAGDDQLQGDAPDAQLKQGHGNDLLDGGLGNDLLIGQGGDDQLFGGAGDDRLSGDDQEVIGGAATLTGRDMLYGGAGRDTLLGGNDDDTLIGGEGQDFVDGGKGNDTYVIGAPELVSVSANGDKVFAPDFVYATGGTDTLIMADASWASLQVTMALDGLYIQDGSAAVLIKAGNTSSVETLVVDVGPRTLRELTGTRLDQVVQATSTRTDGRLYGGRRADTLAVRFEDAGTVVAGGQGNDSIAINGSGGATLQFALGDGVDTVGYTARQSGAASAVVARMVGGDSEGMASVASTLEGGGTAAANILELDAGITLAQVHLLWRGSGTHTLAIGSNEGIQFNLPTAYSNATDVPLGDWPFDQIRFADGQVATMADVIAQGVLIMPEATTGNDTVTLTLLDDHYQALDGADVVHGAQGNDTIIGDGGDDQLFGDDGNDTLEGWAGNDLLDGGAGDDILFGWLGADVVLGGAGNDVAMDSNAAENDTVALGEGDDAYNFMSGEDTATDLAVSNDTYTVSPATYTGPARWTIADHGGLDTLRVAAVPGGWSEADFTFRNVNGVLTLAFGSAMSVEIDGAIDANGSIVSERMIETLDFEGERVWSGSDLIAKSLAGTDLADVIWGYSTDDVIDGGIAGDQLHGGAGNDVLRGGDGADGVYGGSGDDVLSVGPGGGSMVGEAGDDTYVVDPGDGTVFLGGGGFGVIDPQAGLDTLRIHAARADVSASLDRYIYDTYEDYLDLRLNDAGASVRIHLTSHGLGDHVVDAIQFNDTVVTLDALLQELAPGLPTPGDDNLYGTSLDDDMSGGAGADGLNGRMGDDRLFGGDGDDYINAGPGDDLVSGGRGSDTISLVGGADTVLFDVGDGSDTVYNELAQSPGSQIRFGQGLSAQNVTARWVDADDWHGTGTLLFSTPTAGDEIRVNVNLFSATIGIDSVAFADGTRWSAHDMAGRANDSATAGDDLLMDLFRTGTLLSGGAGSDRLYSFAAPGHLDGGAGDDALYATAPGSQLSGGEGDDYFELKGALGRTVVGGAGTDALNYLYVSGPMTAARIGEDIYTVTFGAASDVVMGVESINLNHNFQFNLTTGRAGIDDASPVLGQVLSASGTLYNAAGLSVTSWQWQAGDGATWADIAGATGATFTPGDNEVGRQLRLRVTFSDNLGTGQVSVSEATQEVVGVNLIRGTSGADSLVGTLGPDRIEGLEGNDSLNGSAGPDLLLGGLGNDRYSVADDSDVIVELWGEGQDEVTSSLDFTLPGQVEDLVLTGAAVVGTGNDLANKLTGTAAANQLSGQAGDDLLDGGLGADLLVGGSGDDTYVVDQAGDQLVEDAGGGFDTVRSTVSMQLAPNFERLLLEGNAPINGSVHLSNLYWPGITIIGNAAANTLTGGDGNDTLDGGAGIDTMAGGRGDDTYISDSATEVITEGAGTGLSYAGWDTVVSSVTRTLGANLEALVLSGSASINGTGNTLANRIVGNDADNQLDGGSGADELLGGKGNDTYLIDNTGDVVMEYAGGGVDRVRSSIAWSLGTELENLSLTGTSAINGTGNDLDNSLVGNSGANRLTGGGGNDTLDGGSGNDTMIGGTGDDVYICNVATDVVTEAANEGIDTVRSAATWTLGAASNLENLTLTGTSAINGTGNALNNILIGNGAINTLTGGAGNDTLDGGVGADKLIGGAGDDIYVIDNASDAITENANEGIDTVQSTLTKTLATNLENMTLIGSSAISATGNTVDNVLLGNGANNTLTGLAGSDTLDGGAGVDTLVGGTQGDGYRFGRGYGVDTVQENDATAGVVDKVLFGAGITSADVAFVRATNNLEARINGTTDKLVIQDWYLGAARQVEQFVFTDGTVLSAAQVLTRVTAAAAAASISRESIGRIGGREGSIQSMASVLEASAGAVAVGQSIVARQALTLISMMALRGSGAEALFERRTEYVQPWRVNADIAQPVM
jgi:Ca2+-binding RTX toxin-like protein